MNVLMITPRIDPEHDLLGFTYGWIEELSKKVDKLVIITHKTGDEKYIRKLGKNVNIYTLDGKNHAVEFVRLMLFVVPKEKIDVIFTHMYPEFTIAIGPFARLLRKPIVMWYTHKHVDMKLKIAASFATKIVSASKESFRYKTDKLVVLGHGIDVEKFRKEKKGSGKYFEILSVGRFSVIKNYETIIDAVDILVNRKGIKNIRATFVGGPENEYFKKIKNLAAEKKLGNFIVFEGIIKHTDILKYYQKANLFVHTSGTGSIDKVVLEAMACEIPILTSNEAFLDIFDDDVRKECFFEKGNYGDLSEKIEHFIENDKKRLKKKLREIVVKGHSVGNVTDNLVFVFESVIGGSVENSSAKTSCM